MTITNSEREAIVVAKGASPGAWALLASPRIQLWLPQSHCVSGMKHGLNLAQVFREGTQSHLLSVPPGQKLVVPA